MDTSTTGPSAGNSPSIVTHLDLQVMYNGFNAAKEPQMKYIRVERGRPVEVSATHPGCGDHWVRQSEPLSQATGWMSSRDFKDLDAARTMATYLTAFTGRTYLPADEGDGVWPRYRVVEAPKVGDEVSRSFNGDTYPCGKVTKVTRTWQVTTDTGATFRRYKQTGGWREAGRGFWLIAGNHYEQNPHF